VHYRSVPAKVAGRGAEPNNEFVLRPSDLVSKSKPGRNNWFNVSRHELETRKSEIAFTLDSEKLTTIPDVGH